MSQSDNIKSSITGFNLSYLFRIRCFNLILLSIISLQHFHANAKNGISDFNLMFTLQTDVVKRTNQTALSKTYSTSDQNWERLLSQTDTLSVKDSKEMIDAAIKARCNNDINCFIDTYKQLIPEIESRFNLRLALAVGEDLVKLSREADDIESEAYAHKDHYRFHKALGQKEEAVEHLDAAIRLFNRIENPHEALICKVYRLELRFGEYAKESQARAVERLLSQQTSEASPATLAFLHLELSIIHLGLHNLEQAKFHLQKLETLANNNADLAYRYNTRIPLLKAKIKLANNEMTAAKKSFLTVLNTARNKPDVWAEIHSLNEMAKIEVALGDFDNASTHLESARQKASQLQLNDMLAENYLILSQLAEAQNDTNLGYEALKKHNHYISLIDDQVSDYYVFNHYRQLERNALTAVMAQKESELFSSKEQLSMSNTVLILLIVILVILLFGFLYLRHNTKKLALRNEVIMNQAEELKTRDKEKTELFTQISHELRTPLTLILAPIKEVSESENISDREGELLKMARKGGAQLKLLVDEILDVHKLESGQMQVEEKATPLRFFFELYLKQFESYCRLKEIDFNYTTNVQKDTLTFIDREKCRQIVFNLLSNAIKYTPKGGTIKADLDIIDGNIHFKVTDSGPGINEEDKANIFNKFFKSNDPKKLNPGGTGIGLYLCQAYVNKFGGEIKVVSEPKKGATFHVSFPVKIAGQISPQGEIELERFKEDAFLAVTSEHIMEVNDTTDKSKPSLLVVEDNITLQTYLKILLSENYMVYTAEHGKAALETLNSDLKIDLILSDIMMPEMDGFELVEHVKATARLKHIPFILLSADVHTEDKIKMLRFGVDDYISKPFEEDVLKARIENLLKNSRERLRELKSQHKNADENPMISEDEKWLDKLERLTKKNIHHTSFSVPELAELLAMSESTLLRKTKLLIGISPSKYIKQTRLNAARELLESKTYTSVKIVAQHVGYADPRVFSRNYKKFFGKSPSDYLNTHNQSFKLN